ncbi:MAG: GNAT family N-acetyltransferase [Rubripirellula sp.]
MTSFRIDAAPLELLQQALPRLLSNLSIARAQIAIDQIRASIDTQSIDRITFLRAIDSPPARPESKPDSTSGEDQSQPQESPDHWLAAVIAIQQSDGPDASSDMATIVHAGDFDLAAPAETDEQAADLTSDPKPEPLMAELSQSLDQELSGRGIRFVQWATDATSTADTTLPRWCQGLGFQSIGTLDYMNLDLGEAKADRSNRDPADHSDGEDRLAFNALPDSQPSLTFTPLDWDSPHELTEFARLVERTYEETLDCPKLASFRTAEQTLKGYQSSTAFDPSTWFRICDPHDHVVGCLVLGRHHDAQTPSPDPSSSVTEIVYMGLTIDARGKGYGAHLVNHANRLVAEFGGHRIILAVDQANQPARTLYQRFGFQRMLTETVWVKRLASASEEKHSDARS